MNQSTDSEKLRLWQRRLRHSESAYAAALNRMDRREELYLGSERLRAMVPGDYKAVTPHVRNVCAELVEAEIDSSIPQPRVTARRPGDEWRAKIIEDMLRNELDRMPFERINDLMERTVPIQGGAGFFVEWDNAQRTWRSVGELSVSPLHPKQIIPQDGVTEIAEMDYLILKIPQTRETIRRRYGVELDDAESEPEVRAGAGDDASAAEDLVTQYIAYSRGDNGGISLYSWVNDTQLEDLEDYQARYLDGERQEYEELYRDVTRSDGSVIPAFSTAGIAMLLGEGETAGFRVPTKIPYYKPDVFPVVLQKNVSLYGSFLGDSDIDKIEDQQNTINRMSAKIIDKLVKSGSYLTLPTDASIRTDAEDMKIIYPESPADKSMIDVVNLQADVQYDLTYLAQVYEEARQAIGITDSYQGRRDSTATSGKAKEFSAAQAAGRMESKRVMKYAAYAELFEIMFKFLLAYSDEPRPVAHRDIHGNAQYRTFNRYDFLEQDEAGEWHWNDQFLFSCDVTSPLASNREAMWQETRQNFTSGAFGDPTQLKTLILFWSKMESLHYPDAGETRAWLEEELRQQQQAQRNAQQNAQQTQPFAGAAQTPDHPQIDRKTGGVTG